MSNLGHIGHNRLTILPQTQEAISNRRRRLYPLLGVVTAAAVIATGASAGLRSIYDRNQSPASQGQRTAAATASFSETCSAAHGTLVLEPGAIIRTDPHVKKGDISNSFYRIPDGAPVTLADTPVFMCPDSGNGPWYVFSENGLGLEEPAGPFGDGDDGLVAVNNVKSGFTKQP